MRGIYYFHTHTNLWCDIGYNFVIDQYGQIFEGRYGGIAQAVIGAHAGGFNTGSSGIALLGTFSSVGISSAMYSALRWLVTWEAELHHINPLGYGTAVAGNFAGARWPAGTVVTLPTIIGHRDVDFTDCPGAGAYSSLPRLRADVAVELPPVNPYTLTINQHWWDLGGPSSPDGIPTTSQLFTLDGIGQYEHFQYGSIYWTPATGAREVQGWIRQRWAALGWERSVVGYPITDETRTPDGVGRYNNFQHGSIYWTPATGAWEIHGLIRQHWAALGGVGSVVGYPTSNETRTRDGVGRYSNFQYGSIYWTPATGAWEVHGWIRQRWAALGWERSVVGYPITDETRTIDGVGRYNNFQNGSIYWTPATGAWEIQGLIRQHWAALGGVGSVVGYPTSNETRLPDGIGRYNNFQNGNIYWSPANGAFEVHGPILQAYLSVGATQSPLGDPTSDVFSTPSGVRSTFQGGYIDWLSATDETVITYT
jgi:uncharacterized protein with LGFP repeats